jgi:nanoRNase/pAp phosphatase (c-di-AMP/oligoRNAs hydrolase)
MILPSGSLLKGMQKDGELFPYVERGRLQRVAIICHRHADPDSYLSAYALSALFKELSSSIKVDIITPEGMSALTESLKENFPHETLEESDYDYDLYVAVDVGHTELLKNWLLKVANSPSLKILIDHHPTQEDSIYNKMVVDTNTSSTAEIVLSLFSQLALPVNEKVAQALLVAILFDSQHLAIAGEKTLRASLNLIDNGANIEVARSLLRLPPDYSEIIAKLKGVRRSKLYKISDWMIAITKVGSFQAHVARALVSLGADVAIVAGDFDDETRVSLRSNQRFYDATKIHLGTRIAEIIPKNKGYGGGHATAASFTCSLGEDEAVKSCLMLLSELLNEEPNEIN